MVQAAAWSRDDTEVSEAHRPEFQRTLVTVRWALIMTCSYLILFGDSAAGPRAIGLFVIAAFLASNVMIGRLDAKNVGEQGFRIAIALMDTVFIVATLCVSGQLLVELVILCLGVLILTIAGLRVGVIAIATVGMASAGLFIAWLTGNASVMQSSMLLRVPFLLGAALVYAYLVEAPRASAGKAA